MESPMDFHVASAVVWSGMWCVYTRGHLMRHIRRIMRIVRAAPIIIDSSWETVPNSRYETETITNLYVITRVPGGLNPEKRKWYYDMLYTWSALLQKCYAQEASYENMFMSQINRCGTGSETIARFQEGCVKLFDKLRYLANCVT